MTEPTRRFRGLQGRLLLIIILGATFFSIAAGGLAYHLGQDQAVRTSRATLKDLAQAVEKTVAIGAYAVDPVLLREVVDGLVRNSLVAMVQVQLANGETLAQNPRVEASSASNISVSENMQIEQPLVSPFDETEQLGVLRIYADEARIATIAKAEAKTLAAMMIGQAALVAMLLYGVVALLVSSPIIQLATQLKALPPGSTGLLDTPRFNHNDEISTLINVTNTLLDSNAMILNRERELREEIEKMEAQYRQIFDSSSAGIFVLNEKGWLINSNPTVSKVLGLPLSNMRQFSRDNFIERVFGQPEQVRAMIRESARTSETVSGDLELLQKDDKRRWVHCLISVHDVTDTTASQKLLHEGTTEGVMYDITERKSAETAVRYQAEHDALTGLKNRASSDASIDHFINESVANSSSLSVFCIDLDGFKQINDRHGHDAGDQVLVVCAQRMKKAVRRSTDLIGRRGGDEFIVALRNIGPADPALSETADALLASLCEVIPISNGKTVQIGASIGIACAPLHSIDREELLRMADASMYEVKRTGKNNYAMAFPEGQ
ncbi:sensor domain-containing diguanylate cyclase [Paraglaciecola sp. 20A4]|uniref:sensor domain-containing diguanylate cyclase n=1 Tax=Paraglaciecola sp. 20A4 TaxID=2687288 RepID=UPI00140DDE88|nr:sensor domain-containing diguanylate cyclase [Paraglaciecola sp. 20A4]